MCVVVIDVAYSRKAAQKALAGLVAGEQGQRRFVRFETAAIVGAKLIPMGDVPSRANRELDPEDHIVVICHHGVRSMSVTAWLRQQGFEKAQSMRGGIDAWSRQIDSKVPMY